MGTKGVDHMGRFFIGVGGCRRIDDNGSLPATARCGTRHVGGTFPFTAVLFVTGLALNFVTLFCAVCHVAGGGRVGMLGVTLPVLLSMSFLTLAFKLTLE